jgi:ribosomal protein S18 acetylase RimI-like enzyme
VTLRPATREDEQALRRLDADTWSWQSSPAPPATPDRSFFGPDDDPGDVLVALIDGELAGYVKVRPPTGLESNSHVLAIHGLAVRPEYQRRGVARTLVEAAVEAAAAQGARRLTLRVLGPNTGARAFYEACGFEVEGVLREEFLLDGRYVDDVLMARRVP